MSESDSDFAYESADEDSTENIGESKCSDQDATENIGESKCSDHQDAAENIGESKCSDQDFDTEGNKSIEENRISGTSVDSSVEESCLCQVEEIKSMTLDEPVINTRSLCGDSADIEQNSLLADTSAASTNSFNNQTDISLPKTEPKRVKLRLEKKLQERDQVLNDEKTDSQKNEASLEDSICHPILEEKTQSWGWGSWGTSLLSSAASSVSTFTTQVSQGIETVIETVENTLGAPSPEELAASVVKRKESATSDPDSNVTDSEACPTGETKEGDGDNLSSGTGLLSGVTSLTKALENTGAKVIMGGLDTLELIGKKTIDILTDGDPGLRKKRAVFSENINLSQVLRDARDKADKINSAEIDREEEETIHYSKYFDQFQGLAHLEVLEMLSEQSQSKVQNLMSLSEDVTKKSLLDQIKSICENLPSLDDTSDDEIEHDFVKLILEHSDALQLSLKPEKLLQVQASISLWIQECVDQQNERKLLEPKLLYSKAIGSLAEFTAKSVEQFHKVAELILVQTDMPMDALQYATHLAGFASALSIEVGIMSSRFCNCLSTAADDSEDPDSVTPLITSVYLEASNSTTYIQDAFQLLVPILQLAGLQ